MRVSKELKTSAVFMLLHSLLLISLGIFGEVITPVAQVNSAVLWFMSLIAVEVIIAVGLLFSSRLALYLTPIISAAILFINLNAMLQRGAVNFWNVLFSIFFALVIWLSVSCMIANRK